MKVLLLFPCYAVLNMRDALCHTKPSLAYQTLALQDIPWERVLSCICISVYPPPFRGISPIGDQFQENASIRIRGEFMTTSTTLQAIWTLLLLVIEVNVPPKNLR